jgi:protease I
MSDTKLSGKNVLLIVPALQFRDEEVFEPKRALEDAGAQVTIGASEVRTCHGMSGGSIQADVGFDGLTVDGYDAVVLAGGASVPSAFWKDKKLLALVAAASEAGKVVGALSLSAVVLAKAKVLEGKRATVYYLPEALDELRASGATYAPESVVVDGNIITGEGPRSTDAFSGAIIDALAPAPVGTP